MKRVKTLAAAWAECAMLPNMAGADRQQLRLCRALFMAGARSLMEVLSCETAEKSMQAVEDAREEIARYEQEIADLSARMTSKPSE